MATRKPVTLDPTDIKETDQIQVGGVTLEVERIFIKPDVEEIALVGSNVKTGREIRRKIPRDAKVTVQRLHLNREETIAELWREIQRLYNHMPYGSAREFGTGLRRAISAEDELVKVTMVRDTMLAVNSLLRHLADELRDRNSELSQLRGDVKAVRRLFGFDELLHELKMRTDPPMLLNEDEQAQIRAAAGEDEADNPDPSR